VSRFHFRSSEAASRTLKFQVSDDDHLISQKDVIELWQANSEFRTEYAKALAKAPFGAYLWETPAISRYSLDQPHEFVLIDCPALQQVTPDPVSFSEYFQDARGDIVCFLSLGRDARLVVPCPAGDHTVYGHIAAFIRQAPRPQIHNLLKALGQELANGLSEQPLWTSTNGLGVHWLHLRLDSQPKYYHHAPYRNWPLRGN
jgi:hypothetical protein